MLLDGLLHLLKVRYRTASTARADTAVAISHTTVHPMQNHDGRGAIKPHYSEYNMMWSSVVLGDVQLVLANKDPPHAMRRVDRAQQRGLIS